jgi:O-Antigen ligase
MAYITDTDLRERAGESANTHYFTIILAWLAVINVLTFFYHMLNVSMFNTFSNLLCISLIGYGSYTVYRFSNNATNLLYVVVACTFVVLSIAFNGSKASVTDGIKYLSIYVFYAAGYATASQYRSIEPPLVYFLTALPLVFLVALGGSRVPEFEQLNLGNTFSYFANTNVATLYFAALIFAVAQPLGWSAIFLQFLNIALMNKVGAAVATVAAIGLWIMIPLRRESVLALAAFALAVVCAYSLGAFDRALAMLESMRLLADLGPDYVSRLSFKRLVQVTGTTDLSGFFRVIHWANIWDIYSGSGFGTIIFGYGIGQTPNLTVLALVPHNDYLRILAEYGLINLIVFVCFLAHVLRSLKMGIAKVLFMVLLLYFFSENLIDHFASMTLYFTYAGRFAAMSQEEPPA